MTGAWHEGYEAYPKLDIIENPYDRGSLQGEEWFRGWEAHWMDASIAKSKGRVKAC